MPTKLVFTIVLLKFLRKFSNDNFDKKSHDKKLKLYWTWPSLAPTCLMFQRVYINLNHIKNWWTYSISMFQTPPQLFRQCLNFDFFIDHFLRDYLFITLVYILWFQTYTWLKVLIGLRYSLMHCRCYIID